MSYLSVILIGIVVLPSCGNAVVMKIQIQPFTYDGIIPTSFNITCVPEVTSVCAKRILAIQVSKNDGKPLATLQQQSEISYNQLLRADLKAEGHINKVVGDSRLTVIFSNVMKEDSGLYSCAVIYLDEWGHLQQESATKNFAVDGQDVHDIVRYFMGKLDSMEMMLRNQQAQLLEQEEQFLELENRTRLHLEKDQTSAFFVGLRYAGVLRQGQVLIFRDVQENYGSNYNVANGVYTAPVDGLYTFHLYAMIHRAEGKDKDTEYGLRERVGTVLVEDSDKYDQGSVSSVLHLEAGDEVMCMVHYVSSDELRLHDFPYSGFSGYLIKAL